MEGEVLSVSEVREFVNQTLGYAYPSIVVEGEVSSYRLNQGKWIFFDLKDSETTLSCFMTKYQLNTVLEDGMLVRVTATPNLTKWGKFSLTVKYVELAGSGAVKQAFDKLKAQFETEGLFAPERKRPLPDYPQRVGLITSSEAAAYNDFITIAADRWPLMELDHVHVHVQGVKAPEEVVGAIELLNRCQDSEDALDAIVLIRGGGSAEDLQAFNQENVVRAVYASKTPILVGIGHEDDVSLAELAADVRAATPTDAARRLTPDWREVIRHLGALQQQQAHLVERRIDRARQTVRRLVDVSGRLEVYARQSVQVVQARLLMGWQHHQQDWAHRITVGLKTLHGADPARLLTRGYAIARVGGAIVRDPSQVGSKDEILLQLHKGELIAQRKGERNDEEQTSIRF